MKRFSTLLWVETKLGLRCPDILIFGVAMPVGVFLLISVLGGDQIAGTSDITFVQSSFVALLTVGICATAFMGIPLTFADYRDKKILKHFFVTPVHPIQMFIVQICINAITAIVSACCVSVIAICLFDYQMQGNIGVFIATYFLVLCSMYSIGLILASVCRSVKTANVITSLVYFPMLFLSGATIPYEIFPNSLQTIANILPLTHGIRLLKEVSLGIYSDGSVYSILILLIFAIVSMILSIVLFKWE